MTTLTHALTELQRQQIDYAPASFPIGLRWYVVQTDPLCEFKAEDELKRAGFVVYFPRERRWDRKNNRRSRTKKISEHPLIRGYGFTQFDPNLSEWGKIPGLYGVRDLLRNQGYPQRIPDVAVERLQRKEELGDFDRTKPAQAPFKRGEHVRIFDGPLAPALGFIERFTQRERVQIIHSLLGKVELPIDWLEKL